MYQSGHYGMALIVYSPIMFVLTFFEAYVVATLGMILILSLTRTPDWDLKLPIKHRGPTHTVYFAGLVGLVTGVVVTAILVGIQGKISLFQYAPLQLVLLGLFASFIGVLSIIAHLMADVITPMGLRPFAFRGKHTTRYRYPIARAANPFANGFLLIGGWVLILLAAYFGVVLGSDGPLIDATQIALQYVVFQ